MQTAIKDARVDVRIHADVKELIERAARLSGVSISDFMISQSVAAATEIMQRHSEITLSERDFARFCAALEAEDAPNEAAMAAARRYNEGRMEGGDYHWSSRD